MPIEFKIHGDFRKTERFLERVLNQLYLGELDKYGKMGVEALSAATPQDTGLTASSWSYEIVRNEGLTKIVWKNSNVADGCNIAILLQYGHTSRDGYWIEGEDYINPALTPVFDEIAKGCWEEIKR